MIEVTVTTGFADEPSSNCSGGSRSLSAIDLDEALELCLFALRGAGFMIPVDQRLCLISDSDFVFAHKEFEVDADWDEEDFGIDVEWSDD